MVKTMTLFRPSLIGSFLALFATINVTTAGINFGHRSNYHKTLMCKNGLYGKNCNKLCLKDYHCLRNCPNCNTGQCSSSGSCRWECKPGYYLARCGQKCPSQCLRRSCDIQSGACIHGCKDGWFGRSCDKPCSTGCKERKCSRNDGSCLYSCITGRYGDHCNSNCSDGCNGGVCNSTTGECISGCSKSTFGSTCEKMCSSNCLSKECDEKITNQVSCTHGCVDGWWGQNCQNMCPKHCHTCHRNTGACGKCHDHLFGQNCSKSCSTGCVRQKCLNTGVCMEGCREGFYQPNCSATCNPNCIGCHRDNGLCASCKDVYYGDYCNHACPVNCHHSPCNTSDDCSVQTCDRHSGVCSHGCKMGWFGAQCDKPCSSGCRQNLCDQDDGVCLHSCVPGYYLHNCSLNCQPYCRRCRRGDGLCTECKEDRTGDSCAGRPLQYVRVVGMAVLSFVTLLFLGLCVILSSKGLKRFCTSKAIYLNAVQFSVSPSNDSERSCDDNEQIYEEIDEPIREQEPLYARVQKNQEPLYLTVQ